MHCAHAFSVTDCGFGKHVYDLQHGELLVDLLFCKSIHMHPRLPANASAVYIAWSTYTVILGLIKISLIMFYLQIFNTQSRRFRIIAYIVLVYIIINTLAIFLLTIFACTPVRAFWNRDVEGKCMDIGVLAYANSGSAIAQDFILLIIPLFCVWKLNMKRHKKIAVGLMFSVGTL